MAYEDEDVWWEYEPATGLLHQAPWLWTDYHHGSAYEEFRFAELTPPQARRWIGLDVGWRDSVTLLSSRRTDAKPLNPHRLLAS